MSVSVATRERRAPLPTDPTLPPYLSPQDVCRLLQCGMATLYRRIALGEFPRPLKFGRLSRFSRPAVLEHLRTLETH
jgi:excisionase family DNA binding protein